MVSNPICIVKRAIGRALSGAMLAGWAAVGAAAGVPAAGVPAAGVPAAGAPAAGAPAADSVAAGGALRIHWTHRVAEFTYMGTTTAYTCDVLADQVRRILVYLGARKDPVVTTRGCPRYVPSRFAWVKAEFDVPNPARTDESSDTWAAQWSQVRLDPEHPRFLGPGDCELLEAMRKLVETTLPIRDLSYSTHCFPHTQSPGDFTVTGTVPKAVPASTD